MVFLPWILREGTMTDINEERKLIFLEYLAILAEALSKKAGGYFVWNIIGVEILKAPRDPKEKNPIWVASLWPTENWDSLAFLINPKEPLLGTLKPFIEAFQKPEKQNKLPQK